MSALDPTLAPPVEHRVPIVDVLRDAIRQRLLPPGMQLVQSSLADALGVSKIPVREALRTLASEGLVTFGDDGVRVTALSPAEINELWSLRALIEPAFADAIVAEATTADVERLRRLVVSMDAADDADEWSELNYAFHLELYDVSSLPHFASVATRVLNQIEPYSRVAVNRPAGHAAAQAEHREMLAAIEQRDAGALAEVLERHSTRARALLVEFAESTDEDEPRAVERSAAARAFAARLLSADRVE